MGTLEAHLIAKSSRTRFVTLLKCNLAPLLQLADWQVAGWLNSGVRRHVRAQALDDQLSHLTSSPLREEQMTLVQSTLRYCLLAAATFLAVTGAEAAERAEACVKYEKEYGWSKGYAVEATILEGSELNEKVGSYTRFKSFATYAVIFWGEGEATILQLPAMSMGSLPIFEGQVTDQEGKRWKIKEGHSFCY